MLGMLTWGLYSTTGGSQQVAPRPPPPKVVRAKELLPKIKSAKKTG
jgi:hypothetical protein